MKNKLTALLLALLMITSAGMVSCFRENKNNPAEETNEFETNSPETNAPETSAPETNAPETSAPETNEPETNAPETSAPETNAPETSAPETSAPETEAPETNAPETTAPVVYESYDITFTLSNVTAKAGETVDVAIYIDSEVKANAYMLYDLVYDPDILEFVELTNLGDAGEKSIFGELGLDQEKATVSVALSKSQKLTGKVCDIRFKVKDDAKVGAIAVSMSSIVKLNSDELDNGVNAGIVTVTE